MTIATDQQQYARAQVKLDSSRPMLREFVVPSGSQTHDVAPAPDGTVWYTAQGSDQLGRLDPSTGKTHNTIGASKSGGG
jgi:virginiamycin B lyase